MGQALRQPSDRRLDSWKEIATFFGRDERTVRRWEKENALPVHRVPGGAKGRVFAYESELTAWLSTPQAAERPSESSGSRDVPGEPQKLHPSSTGRWVVGLTVCLVLVGCILVARKGQWFAVHASATRPQPQVSGHKTTSPEAQDFYLKGRYYWNKRTPDDLNRAVDYFTQAIVHDPGYAEAYVGLADCYNLLREFGAMPASEAYPRAIASAQKAVELDPNSAEAHTSLAFASFWGYVRVAEADREFKRALALAPNDAHAHHWYATFLAEIRRFPEAEAEIEQARQLDPSSTPILADKGFILSMAGQTDEALPLLRQVETTEPAFPSAHSYLSELFFYRGDYRPYLEEAETVSKLQHDANSQTVLAAERDALPAGPEALFKAKLQADQKLYDRGLRDNFDLATDYALLGLKPESLHHLQSSYQAHELELCTLEVNRAFRDLRADPAFKDLVARVGLPPIN